jgi:hypothetical protein
VKGVAAFAQFPVDQIVDTYRRLFGRLGTNVSRMAKLQWLARWSSGFGDEMSRPDPRYISPKSRSEVYRSSAYLMTAVLHDERDEWEMCVCVLITNRLTLSDGLRAFRRDYLLFLLPPPPLPLPRPRKHRTSQTASDAARGVRGRACRSGRHRRALSADA